MKNNQHITFIVIGIVAMSMLSCQDDIGEIGSLSAPTNLVVDAAVSQDGSGLVNFSASAEGANVYHYFLALVKVKTPRSAPLGLFKIRIAQAVTIL